MSMTAFSNSPLGEEPLGFYEGDPYRARAETGAPSGRGGRVRCPDRRYQPNGEMGPQLPYLNRDGMGSQYQLHSSGNYRPEDQQNNGFQSSGHNLGRPNHANMYPPCPESTYPTKSYMKSVHHTSSFPSPHQYSPDYSKGRHPPPSHPSNGLSGPLNPLPLENGFREEPSSHLLHGPPAAAMHTLHHSTSNGPPHLPWRPMKPHPTPDLQRPMHDGGHGNKPSFRPVHPEVNFRANSPSYRPSYRMGQGGAIFRPEGPGHGPEMWRKDGFTGPQPRERLPSPVARPQPNWEGNDPRFHSQRRIPDSNPHKTFIPSEERRHNFIPHDRNTGAYSPSLSSQSSWSPGIDETGSPRLKMPLPPPSTPEDGHSMPEFLTDSHHHHHHNPSGLMHSAPVSVDNERSRDANLLRAMSDSRSPNSKAIREDRRHNLHPKGHGYRRHPAVVNGVEMKTDGQYNVRDPRQAVYSRASSRLGYPHSHRVMKEHTYSKRYQEGCEKHPLFCRVGTCSNLSPELLTPVPSSTASKTGGGKRTTSSSSPLASTRPSNTTSPRARGGSTNTPTGESSAQQNPKTSQSDNTPPVTPSGAEQEKVPVTAKTPSSFTANECTTRPSSVMPKSAPTHGSDASCNLPQATLTGEVGKSVRGAVKKDSDAIQAKAKSPLEGEPKETKVWGQDEEKKSSVSSVSSVSSDAAICSLDGFHLDLDLEPTSSSNSNSTCCSESEEMAEERGGDSDMDVEGHSGEGEDGEDGTMEAGSADPGSDGLARKMSTDENQKWTVTSPEPGKMRFSRLDNIDRSPESERVHLKQITSNRIQLRNGRVLPPSSLAFLPASPKLISPPRRATPQLDALKNEAPSTTSSPGPAQLRRSKRLAEVMEEGSQSKETSGEPGGDHESILDPSFEFQLSDVESSDESEFDMPDFDLVPVKPSPPVSSHDMPHTENRSMRGRRGRGRGRGGRRGSKRGGVHRNEEAGPRGHEGVQFYVHEPRTREEEGILKRRRALELEVKRNEKIQSEHTATPDPSPMENVSTRACHKENDTVSVLSGSLPASSSSLDSLQHTLSKGSNSTDFSPDLIARVKKISTARSSGDTPLHKCCRTGKFDMVRYLVLVENSPVNVQDNAGWTPLHEATSNGHTDIAELLLQHGADSNASSRDGTRPIHDAIEIGCLELVKLLIDYKADLMVEYGERTAVEFAMDQNQLEIGAYIKEVIRMRQENEKAKTAAAAVGNSAHQKTAPSRTSKKEKMIKQAADHTPRIPVNGYGPDSVSFGEELDFPLFYVSPIVELSNRPHLSVYNFQISPLGTSNPRRHNFYLMDDLLEVLQMKEEEFIEKCTDVNILELTVAEFLHRMKAPHFNLQVSVPERIKSLPRKRAIKFVPLCSMLSQMLDIVMENLDN